MTPHEVAQAQLDCYNAHDLDGFMACYAEAVEVYEFPATLRSQGKAAMRERYARILFDGSTVHARLEGRIVEGEMVFDHEAITGHPLLGDARIVAIYRVRGGLIDTVWMVRS